MKNFTTLIKESFEMYKRKITTILPALLIFVAVSIILGTLLGGSMMFLVLKLKGAGATEIANALLSSPLVIGIFLVMILWMVFIGLSFLILVIKPVGTKLKEIFQETWKKLWQYFWVVILTSFFIILSSLFLIIPGIIVAIYLSFYPYAFIIEGEKGMNALKRSWALVKNNWWKVFGRLISLNIVFGIIFILLNSISSFFGFVFQSLSMPFGIIFAYLIYLELKKSKEIQAPTPIQVPTQT